MFRVFACSATLALLAAPARAAGAEGEKPAATPGPGSAIVLDLGQHVVGVACQRTVSPYASLQVAADYYQPWTQNNDFLGLSGEANKGGDLKGFIVRTRVFVHPMGRAPEGLWISPFGQTGIGWAVRDGYTGRLAGTVYALGASVGYTALLRKSILLGGGLGAQYHAARFPGGGDPPSFGRLYPHIDIQAGWAF
jgi:hypothetical protein